MPIGGRLRDPYEDEKPHKEKLAHPNLLPHLQEWIVS
jgi:hypothetical protein